MPASKTGIVSNLPGFLLMRIMRVKEKMNVIILFLTIFGHFIHGAINKTKIIWKIKSVVPWQLKASEQFSCLTHRHGK